MNVFGRRKEGIRVWVQREESGGRKE